MAAGVSLYGEPIRDIPAKTLPGRVCPRHPGARLDGGPVWYRCPVGPAGHAVIAADLNNEVTR
jgi:hypothetical protein